MQQLRFATAALFLFAQLACAAGEFEHNASHGKADFSDESRANVAVLLYDGALLLDYGISAEMFLAADYMRAFNVYTVSASGEAAVSILGNTKTDFSFENAPRADVVIVPGGPIWSQVAKDAATTAYLSTQHDDGATLFSICTGALLLAQAGFLEDREATTVHNGLHMLEAISPTTKVRKVGYVDDGDILTAAGSGNAIEATLVLVERFSTAEIADALRDNYLNYPYVD